MADMTDTRTASAKDQPAPLVISRVLHAPRETVFNAWGSAESVKRWFAPPPLTVPEARVEFRPGGAFEVCMQMPDGTRHWSRGAFVAVEPFSRLAFDGQASGDDGRPLFRAETEIVFSDALAGTRLDIIQRYVFDDPDLAKAMVGGASEGWRGTLDNLEREVIRTQGGGETGSHSVVHAIFSLERTYNAPAARVWRALTEEAAKSKWFAGVAGEWDLIERTMDVRPGGRERLRGRWQSGVVSTFDAVYLDVAPERRLIYVYEMWLDDKKISASLATMQLKAEGAHTRLEVTEQGAFLDGYDDAGSRERGTGLLLDALGASLAD